MSRLLGASWEVSYLQLLEHLLDEEPRQTRNGLCHSGFGAAMRIDVGEVYPLITTRKIGKLLAVREWLWFLSGSTHTRDAHPGVQKIWEPWTRRGLGMAYTADNATDIGASYGQILRGRQQWVAYPDQMHEMVRGLIKEPYSRRHVATTWHPDAMAQQQREGMLTTCHGTAIQIFVDGDRLHLLTHQRSADVPVGLPYNLAGYAALLHMICGLTGNRPGVMTYTLGDCHIYANQVELVREQLDRAPLTPPQLELADPSGEVVAYGAWPYADAAFKVLDYAAHEPLPYPVSV